LPNPLKADFAVTPIVEQAFTFIKLLNKELNDEVCDATEDELISEAGNTIINLYTLEFKSLMIALKHPFRVWGQKWQAYYIAPLQPPTLATFRSWGSSAGAGRVRPAGAKIRDETFLRQNVLVNIII